ncbi:hypothetical protein NM208_g17213 [Fusarium decemcellulare]|uniref:Uncharacterized protein n=1 Tax=Fusarium decemcellulare TaxID=57161 RepID=A0ACC1RAM6_9HYPO|nr:hypothetical protein NM208_g17213 [Fusarium decemcellulare]
MQMPQSIGICADQAENVPTAASLICPLLLATESWRWPAGHLARWDLRISPPLGAVDDRRPSSYSSIGDIPPHLTSHPKPCIKSSSSQSAGFGAQIGWEFRDASLGLGRDASRVASRPSRHTEDWIDKHAT